MTTRPTRAPLTALADEEDDAPPQPASRRRVSAPSPTPAPRAEAPAEKAAARTAQSRRASGLRQLNVEIPNETYIMLASLKLTKQVRESRNVTLQTLVIDALDDYIARERAKHLHSD